MKFFEIPGNELLRSDDARIREISDLESEAVGDSELVSFFLRSLLTIFGSRCAPFPVSNAPFSWMDSRYFCNQFR
ncbi:MAG: hypothetical protein WCR47_02570, partial [Desulfoplanes sp.]